MIDSRFLDAIKRFEGFTPQARWDYAQSSNGYGTRAQFEGEVIDRTEAERRFKNEIKIAYDIVERFAPDLDTGAKAALTSLTFNAGPSWTKAGLGQAIRAGDIATARTIFQEYTKAGGQRLAGLEARRAAEAAWFQTGAHDHSDFAAVPQTSLQPKLPMLADSQSQDNNNASNILPAYASTGFPNFKSSDASFVHSVRMHQQGHTLLDSAALTLANILSVLSLSHISTPVQRRDDDHSRSDRTVEDQNSSTNTSQT